MRTKFFSLTVMAGLLGTPLVADAVVIDGKDWRQLTETVNFTWNEINGVCSSGVCAGGTGALATLNGWRWADYGEVTSLLVGLIDGPWSDCVPGTFDCFYAGQSPDIAWAMTQFTPTRTDYPLNIIAVFGWARTPFFQAVLVDDPAFEVAAIVDWQSGDDRFDIVGAWLYRPVPEPGTLALMLTGLAGLGLSRRRAAS